LKLSRSEGHVLNRDYWRTGIPSHNRWPKRLLVFGYKLLPPRYGSQCFMFDIIQARFLSYCNRLVVNCMFLNHSFNFVRLHITTTYICRLLQYAATVYSDPRFVFLFNTGITKHAIPT
jgi:hypothetical protein